MFVVTFAGAPWPPTGPPRAVCGEMDVVVWLTLLGLFANMSRKASA